MENVYQALGRGLRQTAGDIEGAATQMDKSKELRLTLEKMIQDRQYAIQQQRQLEMENAMRDFENNAKMETHKRTEGHRQKIREQREKAAQQAALQAQKGQQTQQLESQRAQAAQAQEFGPQMPEQVGPGQIPQYLQPSPAPQGQPMTPQPPQQGRPGAPDTEDVYGMADDLYGAGSIEGKDWLNFQTQYGKASGRLGDPEMTNLKKESERAKVLAAQALASLRNRTDPNRRGGKSQVDRDALANILAYQSEELEQSMEQLADMRAAPGKYSSDAMGWQAQYGALQARIRMLQAGLIKNAMQAGDPGVLPPSMGGNSAGRINPTDQEFDYVPGQGVVPK